MYVENSFVLLCSDHYSLHNNALFVLRYNFKSIFVNFRKIATGQVYKFELDSLDTTLQTLRDMTLEKRYQGQNVANHQSKCCKIQIPLYFIFITILQL